MKFIKIASALQQGVAHMKNETPCQDRIHIFNKENFTFLGLADGAGSVKNSGEGAEHILEHLSLKLQDDICTLLENEESSKLLTTFIEKTLQIYAKEKEFDFDSLASTLLVVAIYEDKYLLLHIGDGLIGRVNREGVLEVMSKPENGEFSNFTYFTTTLDYTERIRLQIGLLEDIKNGVILCSDGVQDSIYDAQNNRIIPIVKTMVNWLDDNPSEEVSQHLAFNLKENFAQKSSDDLSIIIMKRIQNVTSI